MGTAFDPYVQYVLGLCLIAMLASAALVPLVGLARIVMLASGAVMGIGAYASSLLVIKLGVPFLWALALASLIGTLSGIVLGLPAVRFQGHHLAMMTLVFQALTMIVIREWKSMTGGAEGMRVPPASVFGYELRSDESSLLFVAVMAALAILALSVLVYGRFGKALRAIASTEVGSEAFGIHLGAYKAGAFATTCTFLAFGGALIAPQLKIIDPESFGILQSIHTLAYPIVGGMTSIGGALLGGGLLRALPEALRGAADYGELAFAVFTVLIVLLLPGGLMAGIQRIGVALRASARTNTSTDATAERFAALSVTREPKSCQSVPILTPALQVVGVQKRFRSLTAIADVSLNVAPGTIHGIIGPNGAGKTTLFNVICGFLEPDSGQVKLFGSDAAGVPARSRIKLGVTRTFQHVAIYGELTLLDNVIIGQGDNGVFSSIFGSITDAVRGPGFQRRQDLAKSALEAVGLYDRRDDRAGSLSLGDQRRLEIARAIASRPKLLLLDEPVSGVGLAEEARLKELLHKLNVDWSLTMLLIEHNIRFVTDCCSSLSVMHQGAIFAEGLPQDVIARKDVGEIYFGKV
ncbi:ATP-binding cassette domain-containing protein [Tardiphaga robiniae]|uniref:Branched-chain amino acid ABC transporter ATP-binding protein/permease n=1 Tax=Tardiphaga robiniae TaxID=943830 RepID=A0A7G6U1J3_9BRAD|nr:branched-chain amino acid ABC transporter ATP-binding protein/permease [Tardiphaga robiniae]QND72875.1 branched-chain amino acid ABC transporter ATP-binding protein/permease [Tardiphaga robiniae]